MVRGLRATLAGICIVVLAGCTATTNGVAVKAPTDPDQPNAALMDTGSYPVTAEAPVDTDGNDAPAAEAHRMAANVVGPWQVDGLVAGQDFFAVAPLEDFGSVAAAVGYPIAPYHWADPFVGIGQAHGFIVGFTTGRVGDGRVQRLQNAVMRFPDPAAAAAALSDMVAITPPDDGSLLSSGKPIHSPWRPNPCDKYPDRIGPDFAASAAVDDGVIVRSFATHGPYIFYQLAIAASAINACETILAALARQADLIDQFAPTDPAGLAKLPHDPTGSLNAHTMPASNGAAPYSVGVWQADGWLHFEDNPIKAATLFSSAGVGWVAQRLTRVYQTHNVSGADRVAEQFTADTAALRDVKPTDSGVPGFPGAQCFERTAPKDWVKHTDVSLPDAWIAMWHFKCIAKTSRYVFMSFSDEEKDAMQQISAQYRILAGE